MRGKLIALGTLLIAFAIFEYFFYTRSISASNAESLIACLLPPAIGNF